ncbi:MAG: hypothetical protein MI864_14880 [Pseudomonadales bacterium]|uniref:Uncharacterized protein n=1 Tax=Oleiphilus messinensis TaxID=141451 RepID=A0A1Y0IGE3_9GAMM|nr:hypothetical protein [Oleiphilus messinensis]ARU58896.1 hypothetical protein OLMES_4908 [Oleiphilus messinensis]MCG8611810.1 hypothetical protein [Pseudomonadales bacterium]
MAHSTHSFARTFFDVSFIVVVLTAALYAFGLLYYDQYLQFWGLDLSEFPLDFSLALVWGFQGILQSSALPAAFSIVAGLFCVGFYIISKALNTSVFSRWPPSDSVKRFFESVESGSFVALSWLVAFALFMLICIALSNEATKKGRAFGEQQFGEFGAINTEYGFSKLETITIKDEKGELSEIIAYKIQCSDKLCALYEPESKKRLNIERSRMFSAVANIDTQAKTTQK